MTLEILRTVEEIANARHELRRLGLSCLSPWPVPFIRRVGLKVGVIRTMSIGDEVKSWDVLMTTRFLRTHLPLYAPVLDIGAYASEITGVLKRAGFTHLAGVDLDRRLTRMPQRDSIRFMVADFMRTPLASGAFAAITAISVIEHGYQGQSLLGEMARLLQPGGYFIASFDYWPQKIDTASAKIFGMDWCIFSKAEVLSLIAEAAGFGLQPCGPLALEVETPIMHWGGKTYTFAWLALQKQPV